MTQGNFRCSREISKYPKHQKNFRPRSKFVANLYAQLPIGSENEAFQVAFTTRLKSAFGRPAALDNNFGTMVGTLISLVLMVEAVYHTKLKERALKGSFAENRDQMSLVEEHGTKRWGLITSCSLPEVTTGLTGLVFHELYEKNIFDF